MFSQISYRCRAQVYTSCRLAMSYPFPTPTSHESPIRVVRFHVGDPTLAEKAVSARHPFLVPQAPGVDGLSWPESDSLFVDSGIMRPPISSVTVTLDRPRGHRLSQGRRPRREGFRPI